MLTRWLIGSWAVAAVVTGANLAAAEGAGIFAQTAPGLWEMSGAPGSKTAPRQCVADVESLAQYEHRGRACTRRVVRQTESSAVIEYSCAGQGFGRSELTLITPRSLRIQTQGIAGGLPFNYVLQARRVGDCPGQKSATRH